MARLNEVRVIVFGVGGVGSWCAEALVRTGLRRITIVDSDEVVPSNCNRQLMATTKTLGRPKVMVLRERLMEINPNADVTAIVRRYTSETFAEFRLEDYDYIIDCIDSLRDKADLICRVTEMKRAKFFSSMGAALRTDPTRVRVMEFRKVQGDALARSLRHYFKRTNRFPAGRFRCVCSEEPAGKNCFESDGNGSLVQVTATFGMTLASLVIADLRAE